MALTILTTERRVRKFLVYDLEWVPGTLKVRLAGVYDPHRGYRCYTTVDEFLRGELTSKNRGWWFYAHAGGLADMLFVLDRLTKGQCKFEVEASFSGSSAIIVHVRYGKNVWHFIDSLWTLRDSLENIAKWMGMSKGENVPGWEDFTQEQKREWYANVPFSDLRAYNQQDCYILWRALDEFENRLLALGGELQMTLASTALRLFRRRFLTESIETSSAVNDRAALSYVSSRVEDIEESSDDCCYYDINSSFPYAMTFPCPGDYLGSQHRLPDHGIYLADCEVEVMDCHLPPIPIRLDKRIFFPIGRWRAWFTNIDLELLQEEEGRIIKVHEVLTFSPFHDLAEYAKTLYQARVKSKDDMEKTVFKLLLNSLYGKFAESPFKSTMHINPSRSILQRFDAAGERWRRQSPLERIDNPVKLPEMLMPGIWLEEHKVDIPHRHVPISTHITSIARRTIFEFMSQCQDVFYVDTDGFSTTEKLFNTNSDLGALKREDVLKHGDWVAPKFYRKILEDDPAKLRAAGLTEKEITDYLKKQQEAGTNQKLKAKGFSLGRKTEAAQKFQQLMENEAIEVERMSRIRELYRRATTCPTEERIIKRIQGKVLPKRFHYPDGTTRAWQVEELEDMLK